MENAIINVVILLLITFLITFILNTRERGKRFFRNKFSTKKKNLP